MWQSPSQIIMAKTEGGVQAFNPASRDLGKVVSRAGGGRWMPGENGFIDRWYMWNRIKREDFGWAVVFTVVCSWVAQFLSSSVFIPSLFYLFFKLSLCELFLNPLFHPSYCSSILRHIFVREAAVLGFQFGSSCWGLVHGQQIAFIRFSWQLNLDCQQLPLFPFTATLSNHSHFYHGYHHRVQSSSLFWPFSLSFLRNTWQTRAVISTALQTDSGLCCTQKNIMETCVPRFINATPEHNID